MPWTKWINTLGVNIQVYKEAGYLQKEMVQKLNPSTISRELKKNSSKVYKRYNAKKVDVISQDRE